MGETVKTEMAGNFSEASKLPPKSQALIYHVHLKEVFENYPDSPSLERTKICFEIFENIVDQTGHLSTVLSIIKDELRKSCFSDTVTAADVEPFYESLPYYMLNKKTSSTRIVEELDAKIQELELSLKLRQEEANLAYKQIILLKQRLEDLVKQNTGMTEEILEMKIIAENAKAEKDLALQRLSAAEIKFEKESIEAKYLQEKTKAAFEQLSAKKFENQAVMPEKSLFGPGTNAIPITAFGLLSNDIKQSVLLENQFNGMLDRLLDDYELNLNQLKAKKELGISEDVVAEEVTS